MLRIGDKFTPVYMGDYFDVVPYRGGVLEGEETQETPVFTIDEYFVDNPQVLIEEVYLFITDFSRTVDACRRMGVENGDIKKWLLDFLEYFKDNQELVEKLIQKLETPTEGEVETDVE